MEIYVINLNRRTDRWEKIKSKFGLFNLVRIEAIEESDSSGIIGCFKSHQKCIELAKKNKLKKILVFEDDCELLNIEPNNFKILLEQMDKLLDDLDDWKILYGAGNKLRPMNLQKKVIEKIEIDNHKYDIFETNFSKTAHFVWYNNLVYDWILNLNPYESGPIDKIWHGKFNCLIIIPFICTQSNDYSDIEKKNCAYTVSLMRYQRRLLEYLKND